ncbi:outer membrane lipoprotein chaperone LolA [Otariodibacter sp.]|uniref:outer membrane lipoprotein chaperone LolA n=1 Tax=Otariodibacter sp. TaxID=3030919 RepID=UPI002601DB2C|nr:outer membrane lipoprotein chaperone LolA [Otariodibacter sp.]
MNNFFKKSLICLSCLSVTSWAFADAQSVQELQKRLDSITQYSANFQQIVRSSKGTIVQQGSGTFQVKRPNLFRMDTKVPQENLIVSDGKTVWFYDPFVSQVTANWVSDVVNNTPFVLLTSNDKKYWNEYDVEQNMDAFILKPKTKSNIKQFDIRIDSNGLLKGFSTIENDGQSNLYVLRNITTAGVSANLFKFNVPKGAELDDQRTGK